MRVSKLLSQSLRRTIPLRYPTQLGIHTIESSHKKDLNRSVVKEREFPDLRPNLQARLAIATTRGDSAACWTAFQDAKETNIPLTIQNYSDILEALTSNIDIKFKHTKSAQINNLPKEEALVVFEELLSSDLLIPFDVFTQVSRVIASRDVSWHSELAIAAEKRMLAQKMQPSAFIVSNWIVAHSTVCPGNARRLYDSLKTRELLGTSHMYTRYAHSLIFGNANTSIDLPRAVRVVVDMIGASYQPHLNLCMKMLAAALDNSDANAASTILTWIDAHGVILEDGIALKILSIAANQNHINLATQTWNLMIKHQNSQEMSPQAYTAMLHVFGRTGDMSSMLSVMLEMETRGFSIPNSLIKVVGGYLATSIRLVDNAYYHLNQIHQDRQEQEEVPSVPLSALNAVIYACALARSSDRAFATFQEIERFGLSPDVFSYNSLLLCCVDERPNFPAIANSLMEDLTRKENIDPDEESYHHLIGCYLASHNSRAVEELVERLGYQGVELQPKTLELIVDYYIKTRRKETALLSLKAMEVKGFSIPWQLQERFHRI